MSEATRTLTSLVMLVAEAGAQARLAQKGVEPKGRARLREVFMPFQACTKHPDEEAVNGRAHYGAERVRYGREWTWRCAACWERIREQREKGTTRNWRTRNVAVVRRGSETP